MKSMRQCAFVYNVDVTDCASLAVNITFVCSYYYLFVFNYFYDIATYVNRDLKKLFGRIMTNNLNKTSLLIRGYLHMSKESHPGSW